MYKLRWKFKQRRLSYVVRQSERQDVGVGRSEKRQQISLNFDCELEFFAYASCGVLQKFIIANTF